MGDFLHCCTHHRWDGPLTAFMEHQDTNMNIYIIKRHATAEWQRVAKQGWDDSIQQFSTQPLTYLFVIFSACCPKGVLEHPIFNSVLWKMTSVGVEYSTDMYYVPWFPTFCHSSLYDFNLLLVSIIGASMFSRCPFVRCLSPFAPPPPPPPPPPRARDTQWY